MERRHYNKADARLPVARTARLSHRASKYEYVWGVSAWVASVIVLSMLVWDVLTVVIYKL